ncbi:MAG: hypothetical protein ACRDP1_06790 [Nocardioidaceae bacterium]
MRIITKGTAVGGALALAGSVVALAGPASVASAASGPAPAPVAHVFVTKAHQILMPVNLRPGMHKFVVRSGGHAAFQIVRVHGAYTKAQLAHDVNWGLGRSKVRWEHRFERHTRLLGGVAASPGHSGTLWVTLRPGNYWVADTNATPTLPRKIRTLHVSGARLVTQAVRSFAHIAAIRDTTWAARPRWIPHTGVLTFTNKARDNHFVELAKLAKGKTIADFRRWINKVKSGQNPGRPPLNPAWDMVTGVVSPGASMQSKYSLAPGHYVLVCWWPDADMGGMPHAFMGMYRGITLR